MFKNSNSFAKESRMASNNVEVFTSHPNMYGKTDQSLFTVSHDHQVSCCAHNFQWRNVLWHAFSSHDPSNYSDRTFSSAKSFLEPTCTRLPDLPLKIFRGLIQRLSRCLVYLIWQKGWSSRDLFHLLIASHLRFRAASFRRPKTLMFIGHWLSYAWSLGKVRR